MGFGYVPVTNVDISINIKYFQIPKVHITLTDL